MPRKVWTPERDARLRELYPRLGPRQVAELLGLTFHSVKARIDELGLRGNRTRPRVWTSERDAQLRTTYLADGLMAATKELQMTRSAVKNRIRQLGLKRPRWFWTEDEDAFLRAHYCRDMRVAAIARHLGRGVAAVGRRARIIGVQSERFWTPEQIERVRTDYAARGATLLAIELLGSADALNVRSIYHLAFRLGVTVPLRHPNSVYNRVKELHGQGYTDARIAKALADYFPGRNDRERVTAIRRRLNLPKNRPDTRAGVANQLKTLGVSSPAMLRVLAHRRVAERYGLPADLRLRQVQIILALVQGPKTKPELAAELGITAWVCNRPRANSTRPDPGHTGTYLSDLCERGLVAWVPLPRSPGCTGPHRRYALTPLALSLLSQTETVA
jgi:hypothetical protein